MDHLSDMSRRGSVRVAVGGPGVTALSLPAGDALASVSLRGGAATVLRTTTTGLLCSPAASRDGQVAHVQVAETAPFAYAPAARRGPRP